MSDTAASSSQPSQYPTTPPTIRILAEGHRAYPEAVTCLLFGNYTMQHRSFLPTPQK